jgi:AcrR family transcriptional regulator
MPTTTPTPRLSAQEIVDAAAELVETDGFEALSMRSLAARFDVTPMALYGYFATKDELLTALTERRFSELELPDDSLAWDERVKEVFRSVHRLLVSHPELAEIVARHHLSAMSAFRGAEVVFDAFHRAGLASRDAVSAFVSLTCFTTGFSQRQAHIDANPTMRMQRLDQLQGLPSGEFQRLAEIASLMVGGLSDEAFEDGLDLLLRGIASRVAA